MKYLSICILLCLCNLFALSIDEWQHIRFSEKNGSNNRAVRMEIDQTNINLNKIVHKSGSSNIELELSLQNAANHSYQATVQAGSSRTYYGLRKQVGTAPTHIVPLRYTGTSLPAPNLLTKVSDDPANDQATNYLDIIAEYVTVSDTKLIVGLQNRGGGFPTGSFFGPWNSYMVGVGNPALDDPYAPGAVAWALQYVSVMGGGIMSSGLFKITGTGFSDVNRVAGISTSIDTATNTLVMSCDMSVLLADSDFMAWYDVNDPKFGLLSLTSTISGTTVSQQDNSNGGVIHPVAFYVDPETVPFGSIATPSLQIEENDLYFQTEYSKPADRFVYDVSFRDGSGVDHSMSSPDPEYSTVMSYRTSNLLTTYPECDNAQGRIWVERLPGVYQQSEVYSYSFVRGVNEPENLQMEVIGDQLVISWDAVTQTPTGTTIQSDYYIVEYASDPQQAYTALPQTEQSTLSIPLSQLGEKAFLKVKASKLIP